LRLCWTWTKPTHPKRVLSAGGHWFAQKCGTVIIYIYSKFAIQKGNKPELRPNCWKKSAPTRPTDKKRYLNHCRFGIFTPGNHHSSDFSQWCTSKSKGIRLSYPIIPPCLLAISLSLLVSSNYFPACLDILIPGIGKKCCKKHWDIWRHKPACF
jgi:hypothetical protein